MLIFDLKLKTHEKGKNVGLKPLFGQNRRLRGSYSGRLLYQDSPRRVANLSFEYKTLFYRPFAASMRDHATKIFLLEAARGFLNFNLFFQLSLERSKKYNHKRGRGSLFPCETKRCVGSASLISDNKLLRPCLTIAFFKVFSKFG